MELTPAERKAVLLLVVLLVLGTLSDWWAARHGTRLPAESASVAVESSREAPEASAGEPVTPPDSVSRARLDLNRATPEQLDELPGVGPVLARRIVEHRARYGPFRDPRDLCAVRGIGPRLYARLRPLVEVRAAQR